MKKLVFQSLLMAIAHGTYLRGECSTIPGTYPGTREGGSLALWSLASLGGRGVLIKREVENVAPLSQPMLGSG